MSSEVREPAVLAPENVVLIGEEENSNGKMLSIVHFNTTSGREDIIGFLPRRFAFGLLMDNGNYHLMHNLLI